jgi:hypothetical protein
MRLLLLLSFAACAGDAYDGGYASPGADAGAGSVGCLSSNECAAGYVCNDFGSCVLPPPPLGDAGTSQPPEIEYDLGTPISSQRFVYVPMTAQDELVRIDGMTLEVTSTRVGDAPREVATIPGSDGAVVLDSTNGTATIVRPTGDTNTVRVLPTLQRLNRLDIDPSGDLVRSRESDQLGRRLPARQLPGRHDREARGGNREGREPHGRVSTE